MKQTPLVRKTPMKRSPMRRKTTKRDNEFSQKTKDAVFARAGGRCEFPGCTKPIECYHHRWRRGQGGPGTAENCLGLCTRDHDYIHANVAESFQQGWLLHPPPLTQCIEIPRG